MTQFRSKESPYWSERFLKDRIKNAFKNFKAAFRKVNDAEIKAASKKFNEAHRRHERTVGVSEKAKSILTLLINLVHRKLFGARKG